MKHIKNTDKEWEHKPGYSKKIFAKPEDLRKEGLLVQELQIAPGQLAKNHYHKIQTEIFYFLNAAGVFKVNNKAIPLEVGNILIVEPNDWHEVSNDSKENFRYVAFKFNWEDNDYYEK